ncbi:ATP-dependent nuclease subunit B [Campylobacter sp. MIT 99-7217]|nr:ATP-dependent nuclease subunit B [Campylobacter sp. MIT 99-7217]
MFCACAKHESIAGVQDNNFTGLSFKPSKEYYFDQEMMKAYAYEFSGEYAQAVDIYKKLFLEYENSLLLESAFLISLNNNLPSKNELNQMASKYWDKNLNLARLSAFYYLSNGDLNKAEALLNKTLIKEKDTRTYELLGDIYVQKRDFNKALNYYHLARKNLEANDLQVENLTIKIAEVQIFSGNKNKAKQELQAYIKQNSCTPKICIFLAKMYSDENNIKGLKNLYIKLYEATLDEKIIYGLIEILIQEENYQEALNLSLKYELNDELVLFLYQGLKRIDEAYMLALKIYNEKKDKKYLLLAAVLEFERATEKKQIDDKVLKSTILKFEEGIDENSESMYLNYYGYLLIDYDLDIKKGIKLVERALEVEPDNFYYMDSLAWGYYKLKDCNKARDIMLQTLHDEEFANIKETKDHVKAISECVTK